MNFNKKDSLLRLTKIQSKKFWKQVMRLFTEGLFLQIVT